MENIWFFICATLIAYFIKGLCGFGNTLVFSSILGFGEININISPVDLLLSVPSNVILTCNTRKHIKLKLIIPATLFLIIGSLPGAFVLKYVDAQNVKIVFGVVVAMLGLEMMMREFFNLKYKDSKLLLATIGFIAGIISGMFGIGALMVAYMGRITKTSDEFKANINAVFMIENIFRLVVYIAIGVVTLTSFYQACLLCPALFLGMFLGMKSSKVLDEKIVKKLVIILLIISGVVLVVSNL